MKNNMRIFLLLVVCLGPCLLLAEGFQFGYVDGRILIGMHPLMRQFDPQTRRFVDTVSQPLPSENPAEFIARLRGRLEEQNKMLAQLDANYADKITGTGMAARKAWWAFWKRRESLRIYRNLIEEAINQTSVHGNFYLNMPSDWTLMPVAMAISSSIRDACEFLRTSNDLSLIFDTSVFTESRPSDGQLLMIPNGHWQIWSGGKTTADDLQQIGWTMKDCISRRFPARAGRPFVAGAMNLNQTAASLLENITLPSSQLPDEQ